MAALHHAGGSVNVLSTPDECFRAVPGPLAPSRYAAVESGDGVALRMAYVDSGPRDAPLVLMLHGEPTWSFLYRTVVDRVVAAGLRAVAPDLIGFGRSDKPAEMADYSYQRHVDWVRSFIEQLGADQVHLVCQDWGGLIGLRLVGEHPERFASVVAMNTTLPTGTRVPESFLAWREESQTMADFDVGGIVSGLCARPLSAAVRAAYNAPFPDDRYKAGARIFPALMPISPDEPSAIANRAAWDGLGRFERPFLTLFGDGDPMTRGNERVFQKRIPGTQGQAHAVLTGVAHFIQEDAGDEIGRRIAAFVRA
jgi:haloalkane dehalogenase